MKYRLFVFDLDETLWSVSEGLCSLVKPPFRIPHPDRIESQEGCSVELYPGVRGLFKFLRKNDCYISLASRNDPKPTIALLEALGIYEYLDFPQLNWRPKEDSIKRIIREIQKRDKVSIKPHEVFFVDDWPDNVQAVKEFGATAILFGQDIQSYEGLQKLLQ